MTTQTQTIGQWLEGLASTNESTERDDRMMQNLLHKAGESHAIVTCGIVYLDGHGTANMPPMDIHSMAKILIKKAGH